MSQAPSTRPELVKERVKYANNASFSFPSKPMPHSILFNFFEYDYNEYINAIKKDENGAIVRNENSSAFSPALNSRAQVANQASLELPFPRQLQDSTQIRVQQFERDFLLERITSGIASMSGDNVEGFGSNLLQGVKDGLSAIRKGGMNIAADPFGAAKEIVSNLGDVDTNKATAMASYLARNIIGGDLSRTLGIVGQRVVNPQETLSFSGVDLREFTFSWDLFPSNKNDSDAIKDIINFLKSRSLPLTEGIADSPAAARAFLKYPDIVEVNLLGVQESHFVRFKRCMIKNVSVNYDGGQGQVSIIKGGVPAAVSLNLTLSEVQIHTAEDYGRVSSDSTPPAVDVLPPAGPNG